MAKIKLNLRLRPTVFSIFYFFLFSLLFSCGETSRENEEIAKIGIELELHRFDQEFGKAGPDGLPDLKARYPYLFPQQYPDSIWTARMNDSLQRELVDEVATEFGEFETETEALKSLFRHLIYYFPAQKPPRVITVISDVDYRNRVILADSILLIGLDNYLGEDHRYYEGIDRYIAKQLSKEFLVSDVASAYANALVRYPDSRSFVAQMVYYGKLLYLKQRLMPDSAPRQLIGFTEEEWQWAGDNEEPIWRYFVERELLYSTDRGLAPRFLDPAPFSKFRLELDNESPGRVGRFIGWQIVNSFMANNEVELNDLIGLPEEEIFKRARYKPSK